MSDAIVLKALSNWSLAGAKFELVAHRENAVYCVTDANGLRYALRLHRSGYQTKLSIQSELDWMKSLRDNGVLVPEPIRGDNGAYLYDIEGHYVDLLSWLSGSPLGATGKPLIISDRNSTFHAIGELMARVHTLSDEWQRPSKFQRPVWDAKGLVGDNPHWGRFWENPYLSPAQAKLFEAVRVKASSTLNHERGNLDFGLIHADMVRENILINENNIQLIDFDDCGFGFRLFDIATTLLRNKNEVDADQLQHAFLLGYGKLRDINLTQLPLFMVLRSLSYVGWIVPRISEAGSKKRLQRFLKDSEELAERYV